MLLHRASARRQEFAEVQTAQWNRGAHRAQAEAPTNCRKRGPSRVSAECAQGERTPRASFPTDQGERKSANPAEKTAPADVPTQYLKALALALCPQPKSFPSRR